MKEPGDATTNGTYGHDVPGAQFWSRTYLQHTPAVVRNKRLDRFRTHLRTSSEEYGNYWARSVTPQGSRFKFKKTEPIFTKQQAPDMLKGQEQDEYLESRAESLPPINNPYREDTPHKDSTELQRIYLPDIRNIEVRLTMADSSVVTLQASPRQPYHFYK